MNWQDYAALIVVFVAASYLVGGLFWKKSNRSAPACGSCGGCGKPDEPKLVSLGPTFNSDLGIMQKK
jgi:hypothetical protein